MAEEIEARAIVDLAISVPPAAARLGLVLLADSGVVATLMPTVDALALRRGVDRGALGRTTGWFTYAIARASLRETPETDLSLTEIGPKDTHAFARIVQQSYGLRRAVDEWSGSAVGRPGWTHEGA